MSPPPIQLPMRRLVAVAYTLVVAGIILAAAAANGQVVDKKGLTLDGAKRVIAAAVAEARKSGGGTAVIAVVDEGGNTIAVERLDNTFAAGANIATGKARTAALFKKPTKFFEEIVNKGRTAMVALSDFTPLKGGVPIVVDGQIVGAIGVSGAASADADEAVAEAGAAALGGTMAMGNAPTTMPADPMSMATPAASMMAPYSLVSFFDRDSVQSSFEKGAILFADPRVNYQVHTSRRTGPGLGEVHTRETDVIYVLEGGATFVTGGTLVDPKPTAPEQIRGSGIAGGETRQLKPGDVIIVPAGVPHWFKDMNAPFRYYVVKVS